MGLLLKNDIFWGPKRAISAAFFEDVSNIIRNKKDYETLQKEIDEAVFYYVWTLDYRDKPLPDVLLLLSAVDKLIEIFDDIYSDRLDEEVIQLYKNSIVTLKNSLINAVKFY